MKKIFFIVFLVLFLFSCSSNPKDGLADYSSNGFSIRVPVKWEILEDKTNILPKPKVGVIELASTSKIKQDGFANSLTVLSEDLAENIESANYSISNNLSQKSEYSSYTEISKKQMKFGEEKESIVYIFDAKYNLQTPKARFLQTGIVCAKKGYVITVSIPPNTKDTLKYEYMISNFRCK